MIKFGNAMKTALNTVIFLLITASCFSQDKLLQSNIKYLTEKVQNYLDKEKTLSGYYSISELGIKMYASVSDKVKDKPEFFLEWKHLPDYQAAFRNCNQYTFDIYKTGKYNLTIPCLRVGRGELIDYIYPPIENRLKGKKIAIDPGHIAHNFEMGDLEKKHIIIKGDSLNGITDSIEIAEGMLTYATAILLKEKLEAEGAIVFLTRTADKCAFGKTYQQWKKDDLKTAVDSLYKIGELKAWQKDHFNSSKVKDRDIFRVVFRDLELAKRVELINNFKPDYTVVIHYNVDETNLDWNKTTNKNYNMCFVGGAFMKNDLSTKEKRFDVSFHL